MKQYKINNAYRVLKRMSEMKFNVKDAYAIYTLIKQIQPAIDFSIEREQQLIQKYDGRMSTEGNISFVHGDTEEDKEIGLNNFQLFKVEMDEMANMDNGIEFKQIKLSYDSFGDQTITPDEISCLEGFVEFE